MNYNNNDYMMLKNSQSICLLTSRIQELENKLAACEQKSTPKSIQFEITLSDTWEFPIDAETDKTPYYIIVSNTIDSNEPVDRSGVKNSYAFKYGLTNLINSKDSIPELTNDVFNEMYNSNNIYMTLITENGKEYVLNSLGKNNNNNIDFLLPIGDKMTHSYGNTRVNIHKKSIGQIIRFITVPNSDIGSLIKENGKYTVKITWM